MLEAQAELRSIYCSVDMLRHVCSRPTGIPDVVLNQLRWHIAPSLHASRRPRQKQHWYLSCTDYRSGKQMMSCHIRMQQEGCENQITCRVSRGFCCGKDGGRSHSSRSGMRSLGRSNVAVLHSANGVTNPQPSVQDTGRQAHGLARHP